MATAEELLRTTPIFSRLSPARPRDHRRSRAGAAFAKGETIFEQDSPSDAFYAIASGRVKIFKMMPNGKDVILEVFGPGDPLGAVAAYMDRPFPASATALEDTICVIIPRPAFFRLLESKPSLVRGLLLGLTMRLVELTNRLAELTGGRIEPRFARLFLKLASEMGRHERGGTFVPLALSRQELADLTGTTIETCIRIMSRWNKDGIVRTEKDGFVVLDSARAGTAGGGLPRLLDVHQIGFDHQQVLLARLPDDREQPVHLDHLLELLVDEPLQEALREVVVVLHRLSISAVICLVTSCSHLSAAATRFGRRECRRRRRDRRDAQSPLVSSRYFTNFIACSRSSSACVKKSLASSVRWLRWKCAAMLTYCMLGAEFVADLVVEGL